MGNRLTGKVAIVTGAGRGLGRAYALALASEGASVVVNDVGAGIGGKGTDRSPADQVAQEIERAGGKAAANYEDVSSFAGAGRIVRTAVDRFGRVDILVTNAGSARLGYLYEMPEADWDHTLATHLKGTFNCVRQAAPLMVKQRGGAIVTITSGAAFGGRVRNGAYGTAKAAIYGMTLAVANELKPFNINVNAVAPGYTLTRAVEHVFSAASPLTAEDRATWSIESRTAQPQAPENVAPLVVYLCTDAARPITGQLFRVFGDRITVYTPPPVVASVYKTGGGLWTVEEVASVLPRSLPGAG